MKKALADYREEARLATVRNHDGLYMRLGLNIGYSLDTATIGAIETKSHGLGLMFDYGAGLTLGYVVIGAEAAFVGIPSPHTTVNGSTLVQPHTAFYSLGGLLVDVYPNPRKGLHFSLTVGAGGATINPRNGNNSSDGFGVLVGGGYDFWVGEQSSIGVTGRLLYIGGAEDDFGSHRALVPVLTVSALWN
jgi:hypothetical protein